MLELKLTQLEGCTPNLEPVRKQERQILRIFRGPDQCCRSTLLNTDPDPAFYFDTDPDHAFQFDTDPTV
jgi:hypothetical protein